MGRIDFDGLQDLVGTVYTDSVSQAGNWLQPRIESIAVGKIAISVIVRDEMCNGYAHIHGGMMALIVDEAIGWAVYSLSTEVHYTSVNLNLDFLYAVAAGERIKAVAEIVRHGKKIINAAVKVYNENGALVCSAQSNLVATSMKIAY